MGNQTSFHDEIKFLTSIILNLFHLQDKTPGDKPWASLRIKTLIIIACTFIGLFLFLLIFSQTIMLDGFSKLEDENTAQNVNRAVNAINSEVAKLDTIAYAWATSEDTCAFLENQNSDFISSIFPDDKFVSTNINIMMITDANGDVIEHKYVNLDYEHQMPTPKSLLAQLSGNRQLTTIDDEKNHISGILLLNSGPMIIASAPIVPVGGGDSLGAVIVGRYLDANEIQKLAERTELSLFVTELDDPALLPDIANANEVLQQNGETIIIRPLGESVIAGYTLLRDIDGNNVLNLKVDIPRAIWQRGIDSIHYNIIILFLIGFVFCGMTMMLLENTVLSPLARLSRNITRLGTKGEISSRISFEGGGEIASVATAVNGMLDSLEHSQRLLAKSQEDLSRLIEDANDSIIIMNLSGHIALANRMAEDITGYSRDELIGIRADSLSEKASPGFIEEVIEGLKSGKYEQKTIEIEIFTKNQQKRILEVSLQLQFDEEEQSVGVFSISRDITDRKQTESELAQYRNKLEELVEERTIALSLTNVQFQQEISDRTAAQNSLAAEKERLAVTLSSIAEGVITTDTEGHITLMNSVAGTLTGYEACDAIKKPIGEVLKLIDNLSHQTIDGHIRTVLTKGEIVNLSSQISIEDTGGREHPVVLSLAPLQKKDTGPGGLVIVFRDISERLRYEEELLKSEKMESIGALAGGIAHDFNNILTAITGNIAIARMMIDEQDQIHDYLTQAEEATLHARDITQQLITFAKGGAPIKKTADISEMIRETVEFVLRGKKSQPVIRIAPDLLPVEVDLGQISQVIQNLVINGDQAMGDGGQIFVSAENIHISRERYGCALGDYIKLTVEDRGAGIEKEKLPRIFDPYFTTKKKGNGLGLASTLSIVKNHGGYIDVYSEIGKGTIFNVYLPASTEAVDTLEEEEIGDLQGTGKILFMDDDEEILNVTPVLLRNSGYFVDIAREGSEAVDLFKKAQERGCPYDVLIMDLTVPGGMGGKEAIAELHKLDHGVRAIVSSGYSNDPVMADHAAYGFVDVLPKPYPIKDLIRKINRQIK